MPKKVETSKKPKSRTAGVGISKKVAPRKKVARAKVIATKAPVKVPTPVRKTVSKTAEPKVSQKSIKKISEVKSDLVKKYRGNAKDTGSVAVQAALLTDRINLLAKHLTKHIHDFDSKRGLLILVGKRRRLLNYLRKTDEKVYAKLIKDLKLKK